MRLEVSNKDRLVNAHLTAWAWKLSCLPLIKELVGNLWILLLEVHWLQGSRSWSTEYELIGGWRGLSGIGAFAAQGTILTHCFGHRHSHTPLNKNAHRLYASHGSSRSCVGDPKRFLDATPISSCAGP